MSNKSIMIFILILLAVSNGLTYEICSDPRITEKNFNSLKKLGGDLKEGLENANYYFEIACRLSEFDSDAPKTRKLSSLINKPTTSGLRTSVPIVDEAGKLTQDFLRKSIQKNSCAT